MLFTKVDIILCIMMYFYYAMSKNITADTIENKILTDN